MPTDCWDCSLIVEIAVWLLRLRVQQHSSHPALQGSPAFSSEPSSGSYFLAQEVTHCPRMDVICYSEVCIFFCSGLVATLGRLVRVLSQYYIDRHCFTNISDFGFRNLGSEFRLDCLFLLWFTFTVGLPVHQGVSSLPKTCTEWY